MGVSTRGIALGSLQSSVRLHTSVWPKPPSIRQGSPDSIKQCLEGFCATAGTFLPPIKWRNRGSTSVWHETRLFQPFLRCTKKVGGLWPILDLCRLNLQLLHWRLLCPRFKWETGLSLSTWRMPIFTCRSSGGTGSSFGLLLEERLISTRFFPLAWPWRRGRSQSAWMLLWPLWGSRAFVYSTTWMIASYQPTPGS